MTLQELEESISQLPPDQLMRFREWFLTLMPRIGIANLKLTLAPAGSMKSSMTRFANIKQA